MPPNEVTVSTRNSAPDWRAMAARSSSGWQTAMVAFMGLIVIIIPAGFIAGRADKIVIERSSGPDQSVAQAVKEAFGHSGYIVMALAFFVCGLQLVFLLMWTIPSWNWPAR